MEMWFDQFKFINRAGEFFKFPGIENPELVQSFMNLTLRDYAQFGVCPDTTKDGQKLLVWTVQPDGRYWADEYGFGMKNDKEINLYAYVDEEGNFLSKFKIYDVGDIKFIGTDREEIALRNLEMRKADENSDTPAATIRKCIGKCLEFLRECRWPFFVWFEIPQQTDCYIVGIRIEKLETRNTWAMSVHFKRKLPIGLANICKTYVTYKINRDKMFEILRLPETPAKIWELVKNLCEREELKIDC